MANPTQNPSPVPGRVPQFSLGDRLRKARESASMEMQDLAAAIDIHRQSVARYENGTAVPKKHVLLSWSMVTGVDFGWIVGDLATSTHDEGSTPTTDLADLRIMPDFGRVILRDLKMINRIKD